MPIVPGAGAGSRNVGKESMIAVIAEAIKDEFLDDEKIRFELCKAWDFEVTEAARMVVVERAARAVYAVVFGPKGLGRAASETVHIEGFAKFFPKYKRTRGETQLPSFGGGPIPQSWRMEKVLITAEEIIQPSLDGLIGKVTGWEYFWGEGEWILHDETTQTWQVGVPSRVAINYGAPVNRRESAGAGVGLWARVKTTTYGRRNPLSYTDPNAAAWFWANTYEVLGSGDEDVLSRPWDFGLPPDFVGPIVVWPVLDPVKSYKATGREYADEAWDLMTREEILAAFPRERWMVEVVQDVTGLKEWKPVVWVNQSDYMLRWGQDQREYWEALGVVFPELGDGDGYFLRDTVVARFDQAFIDACGFPVID